MNGIKKILIVVFYFSFTSCASTYKSIDLETLFYSEKQSCNDKLEVSYSYKIYSTSENKKYVNKELNSNYRAIAIQIRNLTDSSRMLTINNFRIYNIYGELKIGDTNKYCKIVKQKEGVYLLYGLIFPYVTVRFWNSKETYPTPFGLIIGFINTLVANKANSKHAKEIHSNDIYGKTIKPGETLYGIIVLNCSDYYRLQFKYFDK